MFAIGAALLLTVDRRWLWITGAVLQVPVFSFYVAVSPSRTPAFETFGIDLRLLQIPLLLTLVYLAWNRARGPDRRLANLWRVPHTYASCQPPRNILGGPGRRVPGKMSQYQVSVVIPSMRGWPRIGVSLGRLLPQVRRLGAKMVVVDGSGGVPPAHIISTPDVVWMSMPTATGRHLH